MSRCRWEARINSGISLTWSAIPLMQHGTDYGRLMTISQILNGHYHILDVFGLDLKSKVYPKIYLADLPNWPKSLGYH